jgi:hypothetical protein
MQAGDAAQARRHFTTAALTAPFFADAYAGLAKTMPEGVRRQRAEAWSAWLAAHLSLEAQLTSSRMLLCWAWFFGGVLVHSRMSALAAVVGITLCISGASWLPMLADKGLAMNVVVLLVALWGHYLRLHVLTLLWSVLLAVLLAWLHAPLAEALLRLGLLPLCLSFNAGLLLSLGLFGLVKRRMGLDLRVPVDWAVTSPAQIRTFWAQKEVADACWEKLRAGEKSDSVPSEAHANNSHSTSAPNLLSR